MPKALEIVEQHLKEMSELPNDPVREVTSMSNAALMKLLHMAVSECYFTWQDTLYKQASGLPMGGWLSPILANISLEDLEHKVLCSTVSLPKLYFHYVDDIFILWNTKQGDHSKFLSLL